MQKLPLTALQVVPDGLSQPDTSATSWWLDTLWLTLALGCVYTCLHQDAVHHIDTNAMVRSLALPCSAYAHFGHRWVLHGVHALSDGSAPIYGNLLALSVLAAALAAGVSHRACLACGLDRTRAILATLGAGLTLAWVHFATVVEIHAVFLLPVSLMWWFLARFARNPSFTGATLVGLASGIAMTVHYSGVVLPLLVFLGFCAMPSMRRVGLRNAAALWSWAAAVHAAAFCLLYCMDRSFFGTVDSHLTMSFLQQMLGQEPTLSGALAITWWEWLHPFAPWSLGFLVAWRLPGLRLAVIATLLGWLGFLGADMLILHGWYERGAYALPMVVPAACLCAASWQRRWMVVGIAVALALSISNYRGQDPARIPSPDFGQALDSWHRESPGSEFLLGSYAELDSVLVHGSPIPHYAVYEWPFVRWCSIVVADATVRGQLLARVERAHENGGCLVFSKDALAFFQSLPRNERLLSDLEPRYTLESLDHGAFRGLAVRRRR